jgi:hypothetical protein
MLHKNPGSASQHVNLPHPKTLNFAISQPSLLQSFGNRFNCISICSWPLRACQFADWTSQRPLSERMWRFVHYGISKVNWIIEDCSPIYARSYFLFKVWFLLWNQNKPITGCFALHKALPGFFLCIFSSLTYLKKPVFTLSLFQKSEKIPTLLSVGKGPENRPFRDFRPVPSAYRLSTGLGQRSQITEGSIFRPFSTEVCLSRYQL